MKLGIFGGSFNPFHKGHKRALEAFIREISPDKVLVIPTATPPHKEAENCVSDSERLKIIRLSLSGMENVEVCDWEIKEGGKSYTHLTLEHFKEPDCELFLYVGTDMFLTLHEWKNPEKIFSLATVVAFCRENDDMQSLIAQKAFLEEKYSARCILGKSLPLEMSSTEIRKKLKKGEDVSAFLEKNALEFIFKKDLYRFPTERELTEAIKPLLKEERFNHSLGVKKEILSLSKIWGANEKKALVAGLLHDITKNMPNEWQREFIEKNNLKEDDDFLSSPALLHALTGSEYIKKLGIDDPEIISAIRYHTTAKPEMTLLEKLLYVSDFTEPTRNYSDVEFYRSLARTDIDKAVYLGLKWNVENLKKKNQPIYKDTLDALEYYREERTEI